MMRQAKSAGFRIQLLYVALSSPELHIQRVRLRVSQGGHDVPDEDILRRYARSLAHAPEAMRLADEAVVFDNSGLDRQRMLEVRKGRITWRTDPIEAPLRACQYTADLEPGIGPCNHGSGSAFSIESRYPSRRYGEERYRLDSLAASACGAKAIAFRYASTARFRRLVRS